jgi:probable O-glycosylation ligase (exosortase A-associated)
VLVAVAVLGSYSRGGLLALAAMGVVFWFKGRNKMVVAIMFAVVIPMFLALMPAMWYARMGTIQNYQGDTSAENRLNTWQFAWNLANDTPVAGGGFQVFQPGSFAIWAPDPTKVFDAHSIWFGVLAEHGFVGLGLFALLWLLSWRLANNIIHQTRDCQDHQWARDLAGMIQVSLVGFWVGGTFLGLEYWDYPYLLVAVLVLTKVVVGRELEAKASVATGADSSMTPAHAPSGRPLQNPG